MHKKKKTGERSASLVVRAQQGASAISHRSLRFFPSDDACTRRMPLHKSGGAVLCDRRSLSLFLTRLGARSCNCDALASLNMVSCALCALRRPKPWQEPMHALRMRKTTFCSDKINEADRYGKTEQTYFAQHGAVSGRFLEPEPWIPLLKCVQPPLFNYDRSRAAAALALQATLLHAH